MVLKSELTVIQWFVFFGTFCNFPEGDFLVDDSEALADCRNFGSLSSRNCIPVTLATFFQLESDSFTFMWLTKEILLSSSMLGNVFLFLFFSLVPSSLSFKQQQNTGRRPP